MDENRKSIPGYEGIYEADTGGRIWSIHRKLPRGSGFWNRGTLQLKPYTRRTGHLQVVLCKNGRKKSIDVHRLILETFVGPCPPGMECLHKNGNPADNRISNLRWGTRLDNINDLKKSTGFYARQLLSETDLEWVRFLFKNKIFTRKELSGIWPISYAHVCRLLKGVNYVA